CAWISAGSVTAHLWRFLMGGGAACGRGVKFSEAGHRERGCAGAAVPGLRGEPAAADIKEFGRKEQGRSHAERSKGSAFPARIAVLNAINRAFGSKRFPGPAAVEFEAQLVGFGLHHF